MKGGARSKEGGRCGDWTLGLMVVVRYPRTSVIIFLIIILLLCIYGVTKHLYLNCRKSEQEAPTALPEQPPIAPVERVTAPISEPPPPYSEVGIHPNPCSVPQLSIPPYSDF